MEQAFAGRAVVITGGTGGLGSAVVQALLDAGATCHVTWLHDRELSRFEQKDRVTLHQVDCRDENAVVGLYQKVGKLWASLLDTPANRKSMPLNWPNQHWTWSVPSDQTGFERCGQVSVTGEDSDGETLAAAGAALDGAGEEVAAGAHLLGGLHDHGGGAFQVAGGV